MTLDRQRFYQPSIRTGHQFVLAINLYTQSIFQGYISKIGIMNMQRKSILLPPRVMRHESYGDRQRHPYNLNPSTGSGWAVSFIIQLTSQRQVRMISTSHHLLTCLLACYFLKNKKPVHKLRVKWIILLIYILLVKYSADFTQLTIKNPLFSMEDM